MMKIYRHITFFILILTALLTFNLHAQKLTVKTTLEPKKIVIGDWMKFQIEIRHPRNVKILWPVLPDTFGDFEVINRSAIDSSFQSNNIVRKQTVTVTSFDSGTHTFPSFNILFGKLSDTAIHKALTDSFLVTVNLVKVDTSKAIRPIKAPLGMPLSFREVLPFILILAGLALIGFIIYYFIRKRKRKPVFVRSQPKIPPHLIALEKLKNLEEKKLWQKGEVKRYHIELTDITREYIEFRYKIPALESTTDEIMKDITGFITDIKLLADFRWFLETADLVKFAKFLPLPDENEKCLKISYDFVDKTKEEEKKEQPIEVPPPGNNELKDN